MTPGVKSLDYRQYSVMYQTRFFFGNDPERGNRSGRKAFQGGGRSTVGEALDSFNGPRPFTTGN
jgi:hypothetical protein